MITTSSLLEFLLGLFGDPAAAERFRDDPDGALEEAGLTDLCTDDVDAVMPVLQDFGPISFDRDYTTGGNSMSGNGGGGGGGGSGVGGVTDHAHAVQQLTHVLNNYSYTIDDRDTILDQSTNQNIWADGDLHQVFDQEAVIASGDHANAAGEDVDVEDSYNDSHDTEYDIDDSFNDNSDNSTNTDNSVDIEDSFQYEDESDHSTNTDNSVEVEDSFNPDVDVEDSFTYEDDSHTQTNTDSVVVQDNETEVEEAVILVP